MAEKQAAAAWPLARFLQYPIAFLLPGYKSFQSVATPEVEDDTRWLAFWIVTGLVWLAEIVLPFITKIPLYWEFKCVFFVFLQWNKAAIAEQLYQGVVAPFLQWLEPKVDAFVARYVRERTDHYRAAGARTQRRKRSMTTRRSLSPGGFGGLAGGLLMQGAAAAGADMIRAAVAGGEDEGGRGGRDYGGRGEEAYGAIQSLPAEPA